LLPDWETGWEAIPMTEPNACWSLAEKTRVLLKKVANPNCNLTEELEKYIANCAFMAKRLYLREPHFFPFGIPLFTIIFVFVP